jgi:hypothetical protein
MHGLPGAGGLQAGILFHNDHCLGFFFGKKNYCPGVQAGVFAIMIVINIMIIIIKNIIITTTDVHRERSAPSPRAPHMVAH